MASPDRNFANSAIFTQTASGVTPNSGDNSLYFKADGNLYSKNSSGVETPIIGSADWTNYLASISQSSTIVETIQRNSALNDTLSMSNQTLYGAMLTTVVNTSITQLSVNITGALATVPTLFKLGVYTYNESTSVGTLVASTANEPAKTGVIGIATLSLLSPITLTAGVRYVFAVLYNGAITPNLTAINIPSIITSLTPVVSKQIASQTDLPSSITFATTSPRVLWIRGS